MKETEQKEVQKENEQNLAKIKKRILVGAIAIFIVTCYELWSNPNITHLVAVLLSVYMSVSISVLGYVFFKMIIIPCLIKCKKK